MDQNLDKKRVFFKCKQRCTHSVTKMCKFDKFLTIFLTNFYRVHICVSAENSDKFHFYFPGGCAEKKIICSKFFLIFYFFKKKFAKNCQKLSKILSKFADFCKFLKKGVFFAIKINVFTAFTGSPEGQKKGPYCCHFWTLRVQIWTLRTHPVHTGVYT